MRGRQQAETRDRARRRPATLPGRAVPGALRRHAALLGLLAATACAAPGPPPEASAPPSALVRAALAEWEAWGGIVVEGWPETRPADTAATPARVDRLLGYWTAVPGGGGVARRLAAQRAEIRAAYAAADAPEGAAAAAGAMPAGPFGPEDIALYAYPAWSAAFVAAVARNAGLPAEALPPAATHARYIDALLARALADPERAPFRPYAPEERAPRPGDLLCADRARRPLWHWSARLSEAGQFRPMHCDVVVRTPPGVVEAVGGNVSEMVVLRRLPADAAGRVLPAPPTRPQFILILAANGLP